MAQRMFDPLRAQQVLERARQLVESLDGSQREDAIQLLAACTQVFQTPPIGDQKRASELKRRLREGSEILARRGARAMPLGALGRAALAHLAGADADARWLLTECENKMSLFGF